MPVVNKHNIPVPQLAIDFLAKKKIVPTDKWDELQYGEHAHAFTVAHSSGANILDDIFALLNRADAEGISFGEFRNGMLDAMKEKGWYGGAGHGKDEKGYINWRIGVIYDTNMRTAYSQAHYREQLRGAELRPIWVYNSLLSGKNRRQEHIALHGRAFRYDDAFWDTYYPPNGWGCECYVTTESEHSAEQAGIGVEDSGKLELPAIDSAWAYNVGREALAPNFSKYTNLPQAALKDIYANYRNSMDGTRLTKGEFQTLIKRTNEADYKYVNAQYQVGNLEAERFEAMRKKGIADSKIMSTDKQLWHGTGDKTANQKVPERLFEELYETLQTPEAIYEESVADKRYRVFHFVKDTKDGNKLKALLHQRNLASGSTALQVRTVGYAQYEYTGGQYEKIW
ncbi:MAG: hypothetical protein LBO04_00315 [Spirochaetaceae bacterium]|nr:hypothetical protein [Spirochaetaceae bacterium]